MPFFEDLDVDPEDEAEKLETFRLFSRQVLYATLFENETLEISVFDENESGVDEDTEAETNEPPGDETDSEVAQQQMIRDFARYLYNQMSDEFDDPDELSIDGWAELAQEMLTPPEPNKNLMALARSVYRLLKQELTLERERQIRTNVW